MTSILASVSPQERRDKGLALYREIMACDPPAILTPRSATLIDFVYAEIWSRPALSVRDRRIVALTCAAGADAHTVVADHFYAALKLGERTIDELHEFVLHFAVYCGWPKAEVVEAILIEQWQRICDESSSDGDWKPEPLSAAPADQSLRKAGGEQEFRDVNFREAPPRGIPYYDNGILNFVFGEMWKRPGLSRRDRRLITLACVGLDDTIGPIQSHVYSAMKSGDLTYEEMWELVLQFAASSGWPKAQYMQQSADEMHERILDEARS